MSQTDPSDFLPLKPVCFHILLTLAERDCHGYAIRRAVEERTEGRTRLWPTTLYGGLSDLSDAGWIEETEESQADEDNLGRIYYRLTATGHRVLDAEASRLEALVNQARAAQRAGARTA